MFDLVHFYMIDDRTDGMVRQGRVNRTVADELLASATALVETLVVIVPLDVYVQLRSRAVRPCPGILRIGRPWHWR